MSAAALYVVLQDREDKLWFNEVIGRNAISAYGTSIRDLASSRSAPSSSVGRNGDPHAAYFPRGIPFGSLRHQRGEIKRKSPIVADNVEGSAKPISIVGKRLHVIGSYNR